MGIGWKRAPERQLRQERDQLKSEVQQLQADVARLTASLAERDRERDDVRLYKSGEKEQVETLAKQVRHLTIQLADRDNQLQAVEIKTVQQRLTTATDIAKHANRVKEVEESLEQYQDRVAQLSDELAVQAYQSDRREREKDRFRQVLDQAGEAIFVTDPATGRFIDANETACRWLGYERDKLLGMKTSDLDLEFPVDPPGPDEMAHVADTRQVAHRQSLRQGVLRRRNGTTFPVEVAIARRKLGDREYTLVIARDVNARQRLEDAMLEGEEKYRNLFDFSHDAVYVTQRDGTISDVNGAALDFFGYERAEIVGLQAKDLYQRIDDILTFQRGVDDKEFIIDLEMAFKSKDGRPLRGLLSATLRHAGNGSVLGYQCVIRPLTSAEPNGRPSRPSSQARRPSVRADGLVDWVE